MIYAVAGWTDYLDGIAARLTGQYSRLGTLLDPAIDRLLVLAGAIAAWRFSTLPRWALAVLAGRELVMLILSRVALRRGVDVQVRQLGRYAVWPVLSALFFALLFRGWLLDALLYVGLGLTLLATVLYVRDGLRAARDGGPSSLG